MGRVTAVVCAAFDASTDEAIYRVREDVRAAGITLPERPPHRPHFSFAAAAVEQGDELDRVVSVARDVAARHAPIELRLTEVGRFGRAGVVWLGPQHSPALTRLQRDVAVSLEQSWPPAFAERSDPEQWIPHCTLATRIPKPKLREVQAAVLATYTPIDAVVDALAVILVGGRGDTARVALGR